MIRNLFLSVLILFSLNLAIVPVVCADEASMAPGTSLKGTDFTINLGETIVQKDIKGGTRQSWIQQGINYFLGRAIFIMAALIGTAAILTMSVGGFMMLVSGGSETLYDQGKNMVKYALIGLAVTLGAYVMVTSVQLLIRSIWS